MIPLKSKLLSIEEWLQLEIENNVKYAYYTGQVFEMAGGSFNHNTLAQDMSRIAANALIATESGCDYHNSEMKLELSPNQKYVYTDGMITCGPPDIVSRSNGIVANPTVIIEVLSDSTEAYDRGEKFSDYRRLKLLQQYVLIHQDKPKVELFTRNTHLWTMQILEGLDKTLVLDSVNIKVSLQALYRRISFD